MKTENIYLHIIYIFTIVLLFIIIKIQKKHILILKKKAANQQALNNIKVINPEILN